MTWLLTVDRRDLDGAQNRRTGHLSSENTQLVAHAVIPGCTQHSAANSTNMFPTAIRTLRSPIVKSLLPSRLLVCPPSRSFATTTRAEMSGNPNDRSKPAGSHGANYHTECTGAALETVHKHSTPVQTGDGLTLFGANFCPFVQRTWIVLEAIGAEYTYKEVDPYKKVSRRFQGMVSSLVHSTHHRTAAHRAKTCSLSTRKGSSRA